MLSFKLNKEFINTYKEKPEPFGFNGLGSLVFYRTYSRIKDDGTYESWAEVCERVINGMYSIQKDHAKQNRRPWNEDKAIKSAQEAYDRMFNLKWTPSGRGLWLVGTPFLHERKVSEATLNCAFISTQDIATKQGHTFEWFMEMLMLGVGVGADTKGSGTVMVNAPDPNRTHTYIIEDSREGWSKSVGYLFDSYVSHDNRTMIFDYSVIRPKGERIKGFGGVASGPEPLIKLHEQMRVFLNNNNGKPLTSRTIVDIFNAIGACVISGNVN